MRILYVVEQIEGAFGGGVINRRNLKLLRQSGHDVELYMIIPPKLSLTQRLWEKVKDYRVYGGLSGKSIEEIENRLRTEKFDAVFVTYSRYGALVRRLKKHFAALEIVTFFHNVEVVYAYQEARTQTNILKAWISTALTYVAEKASVRYSDKLVGLNQRDASLLKKIYHRDVDVILPTSFEDMGADWEKGTSVHSPLRYLFVGSAFYANIQGIRWFVEQVLPSVKGELYVVGRGIAAELEGYANQARLHIVGEVEDLREWYLRTDIVVCPIFLGSGMKTKTAEAMMYGKPIVGTREAFVGYEVDTSRIGGCFDDALEMIGALNDFEKNPAKLKACGQYARTMFVEKYSFDSSLRIMRKAFPADVVK